MLSSARGPRANYVIGIATLLALSESAYPKYFAQISPGLRNFIGNPLAFGMAVAITLSLLFRIGMRQAESDDVELHAVPIRDGKSPWTTRRTTAESDGTLPPEDGGGPPRPRIGDVIGRLDRPEAELDRGGELRHLHDRRACSSRPRSAAARVPGYEPVPRESPPALPRDYAIAGLEEGGGDGRPLRCLPRQPAAERKEWCIASPPDAHHPHLQGLSVATAQLAAVPRCR